MTSKNYDATQIGVPFIRVNDVRISYGVTGVARIQIHEQEAVVLADTSVRNLADLGWADFDVTATDTTAVPLVHPVTGAALGPNTSAQQVMMGILAIVRSSQVARATAAATAAAAAAAAAATAAAAAAAWVAPSGAV